MELDRLRPARLFAPIAVRPLLPLRPRRCPLRPLLSTAIVIAFFLTLAARSSLIRQCANQLAIQGLSGLVVLATMARWVPIVAPLVGTITLATRAHTSPVSPTIRPRLRLPPLRLRLPRVMNFRLKMHPLPAVAVAVSALLIQVVAAMASRVVGALILPAPSILNPMRFV